MSEIKLKQVATMKGGVWDKIHESARRVYDPEGLAPTIHTCGGGNLEPKIVAVRGCEVNILTPKRTEYGKRVRKQYESGQLTEKRKNMQRLEKRKDGLTNTITTVQKDNYLLVPKKTNPIIRKLTPRECFRLMAFTDTDFDKVKAVGMSDSQCYKQAGNSIVVTVLEAIFKEMIGE